MRKGFLLIAVIAFGIFTAASAMASPICNGATKNLVANCGFETGDLTSWIISGNTANPGGNYYGVDGFDANSGNYGAYMSEDAIDGGTSPVVLSQILTTKVGDVYQITFSLEQDTAPDGTTVHTFDSSFGGAALLDLAPTAGSPGSVGVFNQYTFTETATSTSTDLSFSFRNDDWYWSFDDVSVVDTSVPAPEPSSCVLMGAAVLALAGLKRITAA